MSKTARAHCVARRSAPFGSYRLDPLGVPSWRKLGGGYIGVTDGSEKGYVAPGLIFAVEIHGGEPEIRSYTRKGSGLESLKPYATKSLYHMLQNPEIWISRKITFQDMISMCKRLYPDLETPTATEFWNEYGLSFDGIHVENILNLADDED